MAVPRSPEVRRETSPYAELLAKVRRTAREHPGHDHVLLSDLEAGRRVQTHGYRVRLPCFFAWVDPAEGAWPAEVDEWPQADREAVYQRST